MFEPLKSYFKSLKQCPTVIQLFFEIPLSEVWLYFIQCLAALFNKVTARIQYQYGTAVEVGRELEKIKSELRDRKSQMFMGIETRKILRKLKVMCLNRMGFIDPCLDYIELWDHFHYVTVFEWVLLIKDISWEEVEECSNKVEKVCGTKLFDGNELFNQAMHVRRFVTG
jgi:hypothetical protein